MAKIEFFKKLISGILNEKVKTIEPIDRGMDGLKFKVVINAGTEYFCKIKDSHTGVTELPNQENAVLQQVTSQHVVKPIFADIVGNRHVVIQPFINGQDLEDKIKKSGPLSSEEVKKLAHCLLDVAQSLNQVEALHLDIKPANVIAAEDGNFYLVDFGTARFLKKIKGERIFPARRFIAPEVLSYLFNDTDLALQQINILADMYGIGAVLYSAITGKDLAQFFQGSADVLNKVPEPVRATIPNADTSLAELIERLVSKQAADRLMPEDALRILNNKTLPPKTLPVYLFESKPKGEHKDVLPDLNRQGQKCGVYWLSDQDPNLGKRTSVNNLLWETPFKGKGAVENDLLRQYQYGVAALIVSGAELCNPMNAQVVADNIETVRIAINWKNKMAIRKPLLTVIDIDEGLLLSSNLNDIKNSYAGLNTDGIILRVSISTNGTTLDHNHLKAIKSLIKTWVDTNKHVYFDGDLSVLPLLPHGVHGLISTTYPKLNILTHRRVKPKRANRPDGIYIAKFLGIISADNVTSLRGKASGKLATNCACGACAKNLTKRNKLHSWSRVERRQHFVNVFPQEISTIKQLSSVDFKKRVSNTLKEQGKFASIIDFKQGGLKSWLNFL